MMADGREADLVALEHAFWDSMKNKDGKAAAALTARGCILAGAQGASAIEPEMMEQMMGGGWELTDYSFDEQSQQVRFISDDTAIIAYNVKEHLVVEGKPLLLDAHDASVWHRTNGKWLCVLHTESVAGDPFGRDRTRKD